jgi:ubiquinone/menaquinone biosynthesis methyltransferase
MSPAFATGEPPALDRAFDSPDAKRRYNQRLFATIAARYDLITRLLSFGQDQRWKRRVLALAAPRTDDVVLDLACGTGDLAFGASDRGGRVIGLDLTVRMLELGRDRDRARPQTQTTRASAAHLPVTWIAGDMTALPIADGSIDVVTTGYGLRNVPDLAAALAEIRRVLRPGGRLVALDFDRPESRVVRAVYLGYLDAVGGVLGWLLHREPAAYRYIPASIRRYPGAARVVDMMRAAGFAEVRHLPVLGGLMAIHAAKRQP